MVILAPIRAALSLFLLIAVLPPPVDLSQERSRRERAGQH